MVRPDPSAGECLLLPLNSIAGLCSRSASQRLSVCLLHRWCRPPDRKTLAARVRLAPHLRLHHPTRSALQRLQRDRPRARSRHRHLALARDHVRLLAPAEAEEEEEERRLDRGRKATSVRSCSRSGRASRTISIRDSLRPRMVRLRTLRRSPRFRKVSQRQEVLLPRRRQLRLRLSHQQMKDLRIIMKRRRTRAAARDKHRLRSCGLMRRNNSWPKDLTSTSLPAIASSPRTVSRASHTAEVALC